MTLFTPKRDVFALSIIVLVGLNVLVGLLLQSSRSEGFHELQGNEGQTGMSAQPAVTRKTIAVAGKPTDGPAGPGSVGGSSTEPGKPSAHEVFQFYNRAWHCRRYWLIKSSAGSWPDVADLRPDSVDPILRGMVSAAHIVRTVTVDCLNSSPGDAAAAIFHASLEAGRLGNLAAQACFLQGRFFINSDHLREDPDALAAYASVAPRFIAHGLEYGDWEIVNFADSLLDRQLRFGSGPPKWEQAIKTEPDPYLVYRGLRLAHYRSDPGESPYGGYEMLIHMMQGIVKHYHLSDQQLTRADDWAKRVYADRFAGDPPFKPAMTDPFCQRIDHGAGYG